MKCSFGLICLAWAVSVVFGQTGAIAREKPAVADALPAKIGSCMETTIASLSDYWGKPLTARKQEIDQGVAVRFSNKSGQYSRESDPAVARSRVGDKVKICLVSIPSGCPRGDNRGRVYKTTNLRTMQSWSLPDSVHSCGGA